jgi:hypothetical protein
MDKIIDIMIGSLRARRLLAIKYSDKREMEMLNAQEDFLKAIRAEFVKAAIKSKKQAEKKKETKSKILIPTTSVRMK